MRVYLFMVYTVYILKSGSDKRLYIGQTQDLESRLVFHNTGRSIYTKGRGPWKLFSSKEFPSRSEAIKVERKLKNLKSKEVLLDYINKNGFSMY